MIKRHSKMSSMVLGSQKRSSPVRWPLQRKSYNDSVHLTLQYRSARPGWLTKNLSLRNFNSCLTKLRSSISPNAMRSNSCRTNSMPSKRPSVLSTTRYTACKRTLRNRNARCDDCPVRFLRRTLQWNSQRTNLCPSKNQCQLLSSSTMKHCVNLNL